ncbi:MAG: ZIP family metal transporter [Candidatus Dactylopiibacterium sp.]|nr:ZIP family metal transporter [Candidatus Dactylopiibacterium sp.]
MPIAPATTALPQAWLNQLRLHPVAAGGLALSVIAIAVLFAQSLASVFSGVAGTGLRYGLLAGLAGFGATAVGALGGLVLRGVSQKAEDSMLGFAAGMMLAASSFSLILPGIEAGERLTGSGPLGALTVVAGLGLGVLLMLGLDQFTPHTHDSTGNLGPGADRFNRVWLFVFAITLHNLPEGMAMGVSFSQGDMSVGLPLSTAIAIQDIPEGLAVVMALRAVGVRMANAVLLAALSGFMEPLGALLGLGLVGGFALAYPIGLGLAAGAMIFVVSHEVIPETHRNGHQTPATLGLMAGFALMMLLDTALG